MKLTKFATVLFAISGICIFGLISKVTVFAAASMIDVTTNCRIITKLKSQYTVVFSLLLSLPLQNKLKKVHLQTYLFQLATNG